MQERNGREVETIFSRLVVVLDHLAPHRGAFWFGLEWARQFHLPICGVLTPDGAPAGALDCERRCTDTGLPWKVATWSQLCYSNSPRALMRPGDLIVFGQALPQAKKHELFQRTLRSTAIPFVHCSDDCVPMSRVLLLDDADHSEEPYVGTVVDICSSFKAPLVVLTVARSDRAARNRQDATRRLLLERGLDADMDLIVTRDPRSAVLSVARWRRCSLVVISKNSAAPWWRWLRGGINSWLAKTMEPVSVLSFPGTGYTLSPYDSSPPPYPDFFGSLGSRRRANEIPRTAVE